MKQASLAYLISTVFDTSALSGESLGNGPNVMPRGNIIIKTKTTTTTIITRRYRDSHYAIMIMTIVKIKITITISIIVILVEN